MRESKGGGVSEAKLEKKEGVISCIKCRQINKMRFEN